jgi:hypothetical protein
MTATWEEMLLSLEE